MNILSFILTRQSFIVGSMCLFVLGITACASFKKPDSIDEAPIQERALTQERNEIRVSTAVVGDEEARQIFGIDLSRKKIQAVWVRVENNTDRPFILLPTAVDSEYFAPLEVAYAYHKKLAADANAALDEHLLNLNFPIRNLIHPGSTASGYLFTNWQKGLKVIDIDLVGDEFSQNFTFFAFNPDVRQGQDFFDRMRSLFSTGELQIVESKAELRQALEQLPCCVARSKGGPPAEPLNVVIIGKLDDWTTAFIRRDYRRQELNPRYAFGRASDVSGRKLNRKYVRSREHTIRIWQTPIRYHGKPVWVAQTGLRLGGRFAEEEPPEVTMPLNPYVDEARYYLAQDMAYSQALIKVGYVKGSGLAGAAREKDVSKDHQYVTDGLRVVLMFGSRPASLETIDFFDWERLSDYR